MAKSAPSKNAPSAAASAPPTPQATGTYSEPVNESSWTRNAIIVIVVTLLLGIPPLAIGGQMLHLWKLQGTFTLVAPAASAVPASITYEPQLSSPINMVISISSVQVTNTPGASIIIATLDSGYPVSVTRYAQVTTTSTVRWASIMWQGPVNVSSASGGKGWIEASALGSESTAGKRVGDLGALSLSLGQKMSSYGANLIADVYFVQDNSRYFTPSTTNAFTLGGGLRCVLLTMLYANQESHPTTPNLTLFNGVAQGHDPQTASAYHLLGDQAGVDKYLAKNNISGISPAAGNWLGANATTLALVEFYQQLDGFSSHALLNAADEQTVRTDMVNYNQLSVTQLGARSLLGSKGLLVVDSGKNGAGYWEVAAGALTPPNGPPVVVVAVARGQSSSSAAIGVLHDFFTQLGPVING